MCGIVGYVGKKQAAPILLRGLKLLEYRGYDSAGVTLLKDGDFYTVKRTGRVQGLDFITEKEGTIGIGHTRWATHGEPSEQNAHPHLFGEFAIVHNGIIENYFELKREAEARGERFLSETDSEVIAHIIQFYYEGDFLEAVRKGIGRLRGSFALAILCKDFPDKIVLAREKSPLIVGIGADGCYAASDLSAITGITNKIYSLADGEIACLRENSIDFFDKTHKFEKHELSAGLLNETPIIGEYKHFMKKEMAEIPVAIANSIEGFASNSRFFELCEVLCQTKYLQIIGCGTAYHSGIAAKYAIEQLARVPVETEVASEYRYRHPIIFPNTMVIAVSQSGETADTIAAARLAKEQGATIVAVTNVPYSSLTTIADFVLDTHAGTEVAVAATKSYNAQLATLYFLAIALSRARGHSAGFELLRSIPALSEQALSAGELTRAFAKEISDANSVYFIGRGADYASALEGSLKLKEVSYLPSEGYPAGELKHGTLALIEKNTPVVVILSQRALAEKTMNAVNEIYARGGKIFLVTTIPEYTERKEVHASVLLPACEEIFSPILTGIPLQMLAYYTALERGNDPDKPRNLAKSVTVE